MSEHNDSEESREGSAAAENPDSSDSISLEPTVSAAGHGVETVDKVDESQSAEDKTKNAKVAEDGGREDMFVDCSDEIETSESQTTSEEKEEVKDTLVGEIQSRPSSEDEELIAEIAVLQRKVEETVAEKQSVMQNYEEERAALMEIADRVLAYIPPTIHQGGEFLDDSVGDKFSLVERSISLLVEKHNQFLSGVEKLKLCLTDVTPDISMEDEVGTFLIAHDKLLELRAKEIDLVGKLVHFENENMELVEQLDKNKAVLESANAQIGKLEAELEQEKTKCSNTKEKLSLAVTKGKALVQQRDSLKQALAGKTSEIEKYLIQLQEKSSALDSAEQSKDLLVKTEMMAVQLRESLAQKDSLLQKCGEILSEATTEEIESLDLVEKLRGITDERNALKGLTGQIKKLSDALSSVSFPENILSNDIETQVTWLAQSFFVSKEEVYKLQEEIVETREASSKVVDRLVASVLAETQEKSYLQEELEDLRSKYEGAVEKEHQVSYERDQIVNVLLKASGMTIDALENVNISQSDLAKIIGKIKEEAEASIESSYSRAELFERLQSLLFVRNQEVVLYQYLLEEGMTNGAELDKISENLLAVTEELQTLKGEKASLKAELAKSEDKAALIKDKLSMAVKKGKGLVLERENLRKFLDEKNAEIDRLTAELQGQTSACDDMRDQIKNLVTDLESIPTMEAELVAIKEQRNQLEHFLVESNGILQKVIDSIERIDLPTGLGFKEPVEKVKWLGEYLSECQTAKTEAQQELEKLKEESSTLATKLVEAEASMKSIDDALVDAQNSVSKILEEKRELEVAKVQTEQELQKALEEAALQNGKFAEVLVTIKSFEDALTAAEDNISNLTKEKEDALLSKAAVEMELQKSNEQNMTHVSRLSEADKTIHSLEDAFSQAQKSFSLLAEENYQRDIGKSDVEDEMKKLKAEVDSQAGRLADSAMTIKSLEDAILDGENRISDLVKENKIAEQEISALNSKLQVCYQELDESRGKTANCSLELASYVASIQKLQRDDTVSSLLEQSFENKIESLQDVDILLKEIRDCFSDMIGSDLLQNHPFMEDDYSVATLLPDGLDEIFKIEMINGHGNGIDDENIVLQMERTIESLKLRDKSAAGQIGRCSRFLDDFIRALLKRLRVAKDGVIVASELISSLKQRVSDVEMDNQAQENAISMLGRDVKTLLSACTQATEELELEIQNNLSALSSIRLSENFKYSSSMELEAFSGDELINHKLTSEGSGHVQTAEKLLFASRHSRNLGKQIHKLMNMIVSTVEDLHNKLRETKTTCEKLLEERDVNLEKICKLETDIGAVENLYNAMRHKVDDYQVREAALIKEREELLAAHSTATIQEHETQEFSLSASQIKSIFEKINALDISCIESEVENLENHVAANVRKLFYIIDNFGRLQQQINSESQENRSMKLMLEKQVVEIEHLKEEVKEHFSEKQEAERIKTEFALGLESIIQKWGSDDLVGDMKIADLTGMLPVLEKMVRTTNVESENLISKNEELSTKLLDTQKVVDDLSSKVKLLEDSSHGGVTFPEKVQEKGISEPSLSNTEPEISEIQDLAPVGKTSSVSSVPSAAHVRTLRKGSSDHLAISIDPESERLIDNEQSDQDKGHVFKSLNTSGLIPRQGKMIADRIDGIWVSGSRGLMSHPRGRLGLIAYCLFLHLWLLGTIL